ncbi:hypothetical protein BJ166DRAFT_492946 [Pestalotiopsis sp. NC0098]|nr:hypothetical protein BJ166DRAFT_492946 [Pestalotiopsis sp. NC0098]
MRFPSCTMAASVLALSSIVTAALTPDQILSAIQTLTQKSQAVEASAESIIVSGGPLGVMPVILGLTDLSTAATVATAQIQGTHVASDSVDIEAIEDAFRSLVGADEDLLNVMIARAGLLRTVPVAGAPIASLLRPIEGVVNAIATSLIQVTDGTGIRDQVDSLEDTIARAIDAYGGL